MPVKWILHWQPNPGTTVSSQTLTEVCQCVESIHGSKDGRWKATLTYYKPMLRDPSVPTEFPRDFLGIALQEQPGKYYFIIRSHRIILEAESSIQIIMEKLQSYKSRVSLNYEGFQYQLGDFQLRIGKAAPSHSESLRGILMEVLREFPAYFNHEDGFFMYGSVRYDNPGSSNITNVKVEYLPISSLEKSKRILEDFVDILQETITKKSLPGHFIPIEPNFGEYGLADRYTSQPTAIQYAAAMAHLIASGRN